MTYIKSIHMLLLVILTILVTSGTTQLLQRGTPTTVTSRRSERDWPSRTQTDSLVWCMRCSCPRNGMEWNRMHCGFAAGLYTSRPPALSPRFLASGTKQLIPGTLTSNQRFMNVCFLHYPVPVPRKFPKMFST